MKARELGRGGIVVGDVVSLAGDASGQAGTLARIVRVRPRTSALRRSADDTDPVERVIVANADQLVIVCALADPPPRPRLIDRFLVAAYDAGLEPLLCLTKADLAGPERILAAYEPLGIRHVTTGRRPGETGPPETGPPEDGPPETGLADGGLADGGLAGLRAALAGRVSVLVGHSGVGKSTLFNALIPEAERAIGTVSPVTGRGRHTSSSALALRLPPAEPGAGDGGWLIDTPGLRSFGLGHVSAASVLRAFPGLAQAAEECLPGCGHAAGEPGCALDERAAADGSAARLESLRRLLRSREGGDA
jgi:ribosome biogenesis GTPase / thiamine phosphate phosphatase